MIKCSPVLSVFTFPHLFCMTSNRINSLHLFSSGVIDRRNASLLPAQLQLRGSRLENTKTLQLDTLGTLLQRFSAAFIALRWFPFFLFF